MADRTFLSWPFFEERHKKLVSQLESWCAAEVAREPEHETNPEEASKNFVRAMGRAGWLKNSVPAPYGLSKSLDVRSVCLCRETFSRYSSLADFAFAMQGLGSGPISLFGSEAQKNAYLYDVGEGKKIAAFAISEREAGSDVASMSTLAVKDGEDYVIDGEKTWISNAGIADFYVVFARTGDPLDPVGRGSKGLSAFIVDASNPGVRISEKLRVVSPHPLGTIQFQKCRVPMSSMIGAEGEGFKIAMGTLDVFRSTVGAAALGLARCALDEALRRTNERVIFNQRLNELQLTQVKIADMAVKIDASALLIYRAAWLKDSGAERVTREAAMAKLYATEAAQEVIDSAVQLFGGLGVLHGSIVEELYRDIRPLRIYEGTSEVQKLVIAGQTIKSYSSQKN